MNISSIDPMTYIAVVVTINFLTSTANTFGHRELDRLNDLSSYNFNGSPVLERIKGFLGVVG